MANEGMKISQRGLALVKEFEGLYLRAYRDPVGVWTIGYGHTQGVYSGMIITEAQANEFLAQDLLSHASGIFKYVSVQLNQNQFDALASFHFNLGADILNNSTLLIYINARNWVAAANEMKRYVHAGGEVLPGLVRRRNAEATLFLDSITDQPIEKESEEIGMWVFYRANDQSPLMWFNGEHAYPLNNQDEQKAINDIYRANFGKEVPFINHWKEGSPYYSRLANVLKRTPFF